MTYIRARKIEKRAAPPPPPGGSSKGPDGDVMDADFEVVDDKK